MVDDNTTRTPEPTTTTQIRLGMIVLYARDLAASIAFYRLLGLDVPDPEPDRPVAICPTDSGITLIFTTEQIAKTFDRHWTRPDRGYQQLMELVVDDDASVDRVWQRMTAAGYVGTAAPAHPNGSYATMVQDPDGNVVLVTHEPAARSGR